MSNPDPPPIAPLSSHSSGEPNVAGQPNVASQPIEGGEPTVVAGGMWRRRLRKYSRLKIALAIGLPLVLGLGGWLLLHKNAAVEPAIPEPTPAERFREAFLSLQKSEETVARLDAIKIDESMLAELATIDRLTTVQVDCDSISLDTIKKLVAMPKIEQLHLRGVEIDDAMLAEISKSQTIAVLNLPKTKVTPAAIKGLAAMPLLRQLRLGVQGGTNLHGRAVATLKRLRSVHLIGIGITDEGLHPIAELPQLESLYVDDASVTDTGWAWLFQTHPELHVHVDQVHHDRDPQKH